MSRETRLLLLTITLSVAVLVLLSRFRFPDRPPMAVVPPPPLERLAARATYDELAAIVAGVQQTISPGLVVLRLSARSDAPRSLSDLLQSVVADAGVLHVPALRLAPTVAIAAVPPDVQLLGIVGQPADAAPPRLVAVDPVRRLALVEVPPGESGPPRPLALSDLQTPAYVIVVEGTQGGLSFRPLFLGSSDRFADPRWDAPLLAVSSVPLTSPGALIFSTGGQFVGAALVEGGALALAAARDVMATGDRLAAGGAADPVDLGVAVQPLTAALAAALGAASGVVVADVHDGSPADGVLQSADVVVALDGRRVDSPDELLVRVAQAAPGARLRLSVVRARQPMELDVVLSQREGAEDRAEHHGLGLSARREGGSLVTSVASNSAAAHAGIRAGDVIVQADGLGKPTPAQIASLAAPDGARAIAITVERGGRRHVLALPVQ